MKAPLLDTHAWVWWVAGSDRLDRRTLNRLDRLPASQRPLVSAISLWEAAMLVALGRLALRTSFDAWIARAAAPATIEILPITPEVAMEVARLPDTCHRDPADRIIVATARVHQLPVVTLDRAMLDSKLVRGWTL
ncbi:MAG: type II toxin-antitoxin system VapC family toxin [Acidimicrobiia bacterium]|nr:type II toxin-antitoxin system VapC family toxin [Acidimicrobiia bacterium]